MGKRGTIRALTAMTNPACHCYGKETSLSLSVSVSLPSPVVALITGNRRNSPKSDRRGTRATFPLLFGSVIFEIIPTIHLPPLLSSLSLSLSPPLFLFFLLFRHAANAATSIARHRSIEFESNLPGFRLNVRYVRG